MGAAFFPAGRLSVFGRIRERITAVARDPGMTRIFFAVSAAAAANMLRFADSKSMLAKGFVLIIVVVFAIFV